MSSRITVDGADITEHIAAMFDALVGSMDCGSGFLDTETIESILIVAELAGFEAQDPLDAPGVEERDPGTMLGVGPEPQRTVHVPATAQHPAYFASSPEWEAWKDASEKAYAAHKERRAGQIAAWRAQVKAKAAAMRGGDQ